MPELIKDGITYKTDSEKADLFAGLLSGTFKEDKMDVSFDNCHFLSVKAEVDALDFSDTYFIPINRTELRNRIKD